MKHLDGYMGLLKSNTDPTSIIDAMAAKGLEELGANGFECSASERVLLTKYDKEFKVCCGFLDLMGEHGWDDPEREEKILDSLNRYLSYFCSSMEIEVVSNIPLPSTPSEIVHKEKESKFSEKTKELAWMEKSKGAARARLKDSKSAEFKNVYFSNTGGTPMTCGQVNSKNSLGG